MITHRYNIYVSIILINNPNLAKSYHATCYVNASGEFDHVESKISYEKNERREEQEVKHQRS